MKRRGSRDTAMRRNKHIFKLAAAAASLTILAGAPAAVLAQNHASPTKIVESQLLAQSSNPFSALVGKKRERRADRASRSKIERYVLATDDRTFLFEDFTNQARVKFLCAPEDTRIDCRIDPAGPSEEIYVLSANRGPRGDVIYKTVQGDTMLRIASYGGATVFWPGDQVGSAASKSFGEAESLRLAEATSEQARQRAQSATAIISALIGAPLVFELGRLPDADYNAAVIADAVLTAAKGLNNVADDSTGARIIASRIKAVKFTPSDEAEIFLQGSTLHVLYNPHLDIEGRPSSAAMARFLEESL